RAARTRYQPLQHAPRRDRRRPPPVADPHARMPRRLAPVARPHASKIPLGWDAPPPLSSTSHPSLLPPFQNFRFEIFTPDVRARRRHPSPAIRTLVLIEF